jgi:exonuclease SbcD
VLNEICEIADREKVNAIIIAGDLFDAFNPPVEAVELFYKTLKRLADNGRRAVIAIAGNHDSPDRIEAPDPLARECGILFAGYPHSEIAPLELETGLKITHSEPGFIELQLPDIQYRLRILLTPYANELRLKTFLGHDDPNENLRAALKSSWEKTAKSHCDNTGVNILIGHLFMAKEDETVPEEPEDEKPILFMGGSQVIYPSDIPSSLQYVALGHLHKEHMVDYQPCPIVYSGSPLAYSFSEADQKKYVILIEAQPDNPVRLTEISLTHGKKLVRMRFENIDEAVSWLTKNPKVFVELTLVTDNFLSADDRKRINDAHEGIVMIIPELANKELMQNDSSSVIDLNKSLEELFKEFFLNKKGQAPNERILNLFKEVLSEEES